MIREGSALQWQRERKNSRANNRGRKFRVTTRMERSRFSNRPNDAPRRVSVRSASQCTTTVPTSLGRSGHPTSAHVPMTPRRQRSTGNNHFKFGSPAAPCKLNRITLDISGDERKSNHCPIALSSPPLHVIVTWRSSAGLAQRPACVVSPIVRRPSESEQRFFERTISTIDTSTRLRRDRTVDATES